MGLKRLGRNWDVWGRTDPFWAILSQPDKTFNRWDLDEFFATGKGEIDDVMAGLSSLHLQPMFGSALDFGCGAGRLTQALADRFDTVVGVDIAPSMIELANRYNRHPGTCRYVLSESPDLRALHDDSFDFIYSNITLQHVEPKYHETYLQEFLRVLKPGGLLVFQLPSERREHAGARRPSGEPGTARTMKERMVAVAPQAALSAIRRIGDFYRRSRLRLTSDHRVDDALRRGLGPRIDMWGTPRERVLAIVRHHGGTVLDATSDEWAVDWVGFRYTVTKLGAPAAAGIDPSPRHA